MSDRAPMHRLSSHPLQPGRPRAAVSWSGGKDACLALHRAHAEFQFTCAVTMMDETGARSRSHGLRRDVMQAQIAALGLRWVTRDCTWASYEEAFVDALREMQGDGVTHLVCGDILYPEHRAWVERVCGAAQLSAVEPLYGSATLDVFRDFLAMGGEARVVAIEAAKLNPDWLFRQLDESMPAACAEAGVDPCGENGEFHTVVTDCPAFSSPVVLEPGERVLNRGYWAVDVRLGGMTARRSTDSATP